MLGPKKDVSFKKKEHLKSQKIISSLFTNGQSKVIFPYRIVWRTCELPQPVPVQVAFSVPTRYFQTAVDRNRIKRQMRETYRAHKHQLLDNMSNTDQQLAVMIVFIAKNKRPFSLIQSKMIHCIRFLSNTYTNPHEENL